ALPNKLGLTPPSLQPPRQAPPQTQSPSVLVERQRRPVRPPTPRSRVRTFRPEDKEPAIRQETIEGPLLVLPSKGQAVTQRRAKRPDQSPPVVAVNAPPSRNVRQTHSKAKVVASPLRKRASLGAPGTTGKAVRDKRVVTRGVPNPVTPKRDPLVAAKIQGKGKGQYWLEGTREYNNAAGTPTSPPNDSYVILPQSQAEALKFRAAGTPANTKITPRIVDGQQAESYGAGRVFAGPDPLPGGGKNQQPAHNVTARVTRKAPGPLVKRSTALEAESVDTPANKAYLKTVGAELKQNAGYNEILNKGEIGILRPGNISTKGVDAITAEIKGDKARIFLNDFTSPDASKLEKETWKNWYKELAKSMETLS